MVTTVAEQKQQDETDNILGHIVHIAGEIAGAMVDYADEPTADHAEELTDLLSEAEGLIKQHQKLLAS